MTNTEKPIYGERQPIETAPRDGTEVLLIDETAEISEIKMCSDVYVVINLGYGETDGYWLHTENDDGFTPTHWMPLPTGREGDAMRLMRGALEKIKELAGNDVEYKKIFAFYKIAEQALAEANEITGE